MSCVWKDIPSCLGYQASSDGLIRSRRVVLCLVLNNKGYYSVKIGKNKKQAHRLVAEAFFGPSDLQVNHKDGIKTHNRPSNLEYVTQLENAQHASRTGLLATEFRNAACKRSNVDVQALKARASEGYKTLAKEFGLSESHTRNILNGYKRTKV